MRKYHLIARGYWQGFTDDSHLNVGATIASLGIRDAYADALCDRRDAVIYRRQEGINQISGCDIPVGAIIVEPLVPAYRNQKDITAQDKEIVEKLSAELEKSWEEGNSE